MRYQVTKLDRRHSHHQRFAYMIEFSKRSLHSYSYMGTGALDFDRARRWFNDTYGWSQEVHLQPSIVTQAGLTNQPADINPHWAFNIEYKNFRIYTNEAEAAWFQLKFVNES